ncbi:hypothetical protein BKA67DRAFT_537308 [Truncatella angustata]|uniref:Polyketide synthase n=1 Tax=Truncatella angustata TaxID=152316 RepID=A0A9P8UFU7_9PEZI|nr:uncharacterized protein BKA67DRAFT_537308 [Truncatella angustata]KAH6651430.1 hypothetical protein BKA67DRAFT_537308 [Truncatella angustata]
MYFTVDIDGPYQPVAIVGMGCRWAGGVRDAPGLWDLLRSNRDGWKEFADPRFSNKGFYHPNQDRAGSMRTRGGFLVEEDARLFDHSFFGIIGREVETMDPSQRKLLEVVYEAFESGGETLDSISNTRTGVYIGNFALDHLLIQARDWESPKPYAATGADTSILANRISYIFNLHGPSLTTNTACSSSMYALHMAVSAIRSGDCDGAIVAAANWISDPSMQFVLDKLGALSPTSRCHTFDASADGYARGEGYAALYLKKSSVAILDGLPIRAMIRGTAINANGRAGGITRPKSAGQEDVIRKAYENSGSLPFSDTTFFECHGTGTQAGDPIEVSAIGSVFASSRSDSPEDRLLIGSIKPNLGHTEGASAISSVMKVVLSLEAGAIPPTFGVTRLNPNISFQDAKVEVVTGATIPWPEGKLRRASINSFGFGGANGHCVIDHVNNVLPEYVKPGIVRSQLHGNDASKNGQNGTANIAKNGNGTKSAVPSHMPPIYKPIMIANAQAQTRQLVLLSFSAHSTSSLKLNIEALSDAVGQWPLADLAWTLAEKRSRLQHRTFRIVDKDDVSAGLSVDQRLFTSSLQVANVGYVFTGQGAQWHSMGAGMLQYEVFQATIAYLDDVLATLPNPPAWEIMETLSGAYDLDHIQSPIVSQVACTALQIGLVDILASWGIRPVAVVGHSSGEMAASYASGHVSASEAITSAYFRGVAVSGNKKQGAMLAVGLSADQVTQYLHGREEQIRIAAINSPGSVTISGDVDAIEILTGVLTKDGVFVRALRTGGNAYHSHHMIDIGRDYSNMLSGGIEHIKEAGLVDDRQKYPLIPWISSVTPDKTVTGNPVMASYWRADLESPVRFTQAVTNMMALKDCPTIDVLVEIGPHPALKSPVEQILKSIGKTIHHVGTLSRGKDDQDSMLHLAGTLFCLNTGVNLAAVNGIDDKLGDGSWCLTHGCTIADLPTYRFTYGPVSYAEGMASKDYRLRSVLRHDLIGSIIPGSSKLQPQWRNSLRIKDIPWLGDHRLLPATLVDAVFPAAGFIAMAIEAATQAHHGLSDSSTITGYSLRKVDIKTALRIPEDDDGIHIFLSLKLADTATAKSPSWTSFTVHSVGQNSNEWVEHCTGLVKIETSDYIPSKTLDAQMDPRFPDERSWYRRFADIGIGYGPTFQPLSMIEVDPTSNIAKAAVRLDTTAGTIDGGESFYPIHPASLDATFQLGLIACYGGQIEAANTAFVPVHLSQLYLRTGLSQTRGTAIAHGRIQGLRGAYIQLQMLDQNGDVTLEIDTLRCISFKESKTSGKSQHEKNYSSPFTRLAWKPDIRTLSNCQIQKLFPPPPKNSAGALQLEKVDMLCCLAVADVYDNFVKCTDGPQPQGELRHWLAWVKHCGENDERASMSEARSLPEAQRRHRLNNLYIELGDRPEAIAARRLHENMREILDGHKNGIDVLVPDGLLTLLYEIGHVITGSYPQISRVMDRLGHANPSLRILEVGAGTGTATRVAMKALTGSNGFKRYADYTFTDISPGFLTAAHDFMSEYDDVIYSVLDIEQDPLSSGYEPVYDVVLACEAIHATANMDKTLSNCRKLLKPGGKLVLVESTRMRVLLSLLYGTLTGYWAGSADGRTEGPFMNEQTWDMRLKQAGFSGKELILNDYDSPHSTTSVIVSTSLAEENMEKPNTGDAREDIKMIHIVHGGVNVPKLLQEIVDEFERRGVRTKKIGLDEEMELDEGSRIVVFLGKEDDLFDADAQRLHKFQKMVKSSRSMVWLTKSGMVRGEDPQGAFMAGLLRTIATENPASRFLSIDINTHESEPTEARLVDNIIDQEFNLQEEEHEDTIRESEFTWQDGCMWVSWVLPDQGLSVYAEKLSKPSIEGTIMRHIGSQDPIRAVFETPGILSSLYFRAYTELLQPLPASNIEVKVAAVGLNWKDLGLTSDKFNANGTNLSSEYTGTITKIGANVKGFSIGDRVYGVGRGHFGTHTSVPAAYAQKLQPSDDWCELATMPLVYMSAIYSFEHVARLRSGQKVLIQSATGGLGLAAIQVAQSKKAEIFATAGTAEKMRFLVDSMGIAPDHVFSSRDPKALIGAAKTTMKGGFDIILSNVVGGDLLHDSLVSLAPMGHLIDIGRLDVLESKDIGLELFQKNANFSSFDLNTVIESDPELGTELMRTMDNYYRAGFIAPIRPYSVFDISELDQVLIGFSKGTHLGKYVMSFQKPDSLVKTLQEPPKASFDTQAVYVVTGGLGGLGRAIISWMVKRGARDFLVLSRFGIRTPAAQQLVDGLASQDVRIEAMLCDVSRWEEVDTVLRKLKSKARPVKGVVHAAMSLSDLSFDRLNIDQWRSGYAAKALGTINLHRATQSLPLDFFVMITSTESIWAPPTQASYIAANNFQNYFARYRRRLGMPASMVAYGLVSDVGSDFRHTAVGTDGMYIRNKALTISEYQVIAQLEPAFLRSEDLVPTHSQWIGYEQDPLAAANFYTCLDPAALARLDAPGIPRWHSDARVSLVVRSMQDAQRRGTGSDAEDKNGESGKSAMTRLRQAFDDGVKAGVEAREDTVALVEEGITTTVAEMLFNGKSNVNLAKSVADHGVDSLIAAELRNWFHQALRTNLLMLDLLDAHTSIKALAESVVEKALVK